ncbi:MAG TPA: phage holin family protein [Rhodocyclaceae bacterium]|nr:phage holin family protein [Rhodocyclaceae bacterium]
MAASRPGLLGSLRNLLAHGLELAQVRLELFLTELEEEKQRLLKLLAFGAAALLLLIVGLVFLAIFITVWLWDEHRLLALGLCSLFFLSSGLIALSTARGAARRDGKPLAATLDELAQDQAALRTPPRS